MIDTNNILRASKRKAPNSCVSSGSAYLLSPMSSKATTRYSYSWTLPGCEKHSLDLTYDEGVGVGDEGGVLEVEARRAKPLEEGFKYVAEARSDFVRGRIPIPADVDYTESEATYENGLLRVRLPKRQTSEIDLN